MTSNIARLPGAPPPRAPEPDDIVARVRAELDASGLSLKAAAHEMGRGVSVTTLSQWLRGTYRGDAGAVTERVERWLETRHETARRSLHAAGLDRHVELGQTQEITGVLAHAQAAGDVVLIHGPSGAGKSWAATRYCATRTGAVRMQVTAAVTTLAGLLARVAAAVGAGGRHPSALAAEDAVVERLAGRGALLVVDEAHHLTPRLLDELRGVRDLSGAGLALIGADALYVKLAGGSGCGQITGRIGIRLPLRAAPDADVADLAATVLGRPATERELKRCAAVARGAGGLHALRRLLARAWLLARGEGRERVEPGDLAAAAEAGAT